MVSYKKWHHNEKRIWQQCQYWYIIPKSVKNNIWWVISMYFSILIILGQNKIMFSFRNTAQPLWLNKILSKHNDVYDYHNINTIMTALTLFWCFYYILWIYFTPVSSDFIVNFKQVIVCRVATRLNKAKQLISNIDDPSLSIIIQQMVKNSNRWWWVSLIIVLPEFSNW